MAYSGLNWTQTTHVRLFEQVLDQSISHGHMRVVLPSGSELGQFGHPTAAKAVDAGERAVVLWIHDADMLSMVVRDSDIGLGDAYMRGMFDVAEIVVSRSAPADASMEGPSTEKLVADAGLVALLEIMTHNLGRATELLDAGPLAALVAGAAAAWAWVWSEAAWDARLARARTALLEDVGPAYARLQAMLEDHRDRSTTADASSQLTAAAVPCLTAKTISRTSST